MSGEGAGKTVAELAALVGGSVRGDGGALVARVASIERAGEGDVVFVEDEKLFEGARSCGASCVIAPAGAPLEGAPSVIEVARPKLAFALAAVALAPPRRRAPGVHPSARVSEGARLGEGVHVAAAAFVG
ncbi:MAG TPA: LpxD N-terminal domain-containing protein, partial [Pyrinomonadaceae bacterium]|nr:LpxD N-terminal domain-containing protein [Pyrinomonadaceae bacterium]